eukprot:jgi/Astpho2/3004/Aster-03313
MLLARLHDTATARVVLVVSVHLKAKAGAENDQLREQQAMLQHPMGLQSMWSQADVHSGWTTWKIREAESPKRIIDFVFHSSELVPVRRRNHGGNHSRSSAFSALPQGLSGGLGLPEFALFSQLQELAAFSNPQQSTFSQR